jgi:hypothetical protein
MNCWHCERPAHAICRFCGRAVCKEHTQTMPFILAVFPGAEGKARALIVGDTVYCGVCRPQQDPITLTDL